MGRPSSTDDGRTALRSGAFLTATQAFTRGIQLVLVIVATRAVSESDFGRFSVASGLLVLGGLIADLGTGPALIKLTSRRPDRAGELLGGSLLASGALGLLGWAISTAVAVAVYDHTQAVDVAIMTSSLPFFAVNTSIYAALDGTGRMPARSVVAAVQPLVAAGVAAIVVAQSHDIRRAIWCAPIGAALVTVAGLVVLRRAGLLAAGVRPARGIVGEVVRLALPFALLSSLGSLSARFDLLLLGAHDGPDAAASYDLALRSCEALWYLCTIVTAPTMVLLSRRLGAGDVDGAHRAYDLAIRIAYLAGLAISVLIVVLAQPITELLGGGSYQHSATALAISGSVLWLSYASFVQGTLILAGDHLRRGLLAAGLLTLLTMAVDVALIVPFGVRGAAVAAALGVVATVVGCAVLHQRTLGWSTPGPPLPLVGVAVVALGAGLALHQLPVLGGVVAAAVLGAGTMATGVLRPSEARRLLSGIRGPRVDEPVELEP